MSTVEIFRTLTEISPFTAPDGARIQELAGRSNGFTSHSLAMIVHPPGTAAAEHHHTVADEVYLVQAGTYARGRRKQGDRAGGCGADPPRTAAQGDERWAG